MNFAPYGLRAVLKEVAAPTDIAEAWSWGVLTLNEYIGALACLQRERRQWACPIDETRLGILCICGSEPRRPREMADILECPTEEVAGQCEILRRHGLLQRRLNAYGQRIYRLTREGERVANVTYERECAA